MSLSQHGLHAKSSKLARRGGFAHSSYLYPILIRGVAPSLHSVAQLISLFQEATRVSILGTCSLRVFLTILAARLLLVFVDAITSCFYPDCWVGTFSVLRAQTLECVRVVPIPLVELPHQLPGHHRFEFDAERKLDTIVRTLKDNLHNLAFLYQRSDDC